MSGNSDKSEVRNDSARRDDKPAEEKPKKIDVSGAQVTGGALASVTAAFLGSQLGVAGTIVGAGLTSVIITVGGALYQRSLEISKDKAKVAANKAAERRQRHPGAPTTVLDSAAARNAVAGGGNVRSGAADGPHPASKAGPPGSAGNVAGRPNAAAHQQVGWWANAARSSGASPAAGRAESATEHVGRQQSPPNELSAGTFWPGGERVVDETTRRDTPAERTTQVGRADAMRKLRWDGTQFIPGESRTTSDQRAEPTEVSGTRDAAWQPNRNAPTAAQPTTAQPTTAQPTARQPGRDGSGPGAKSPGADADPAKAGARGTEIAPDEPSGGKRGRGFRWVMAGVTCALTFVLGMLVVTGFEVFTGQPLSGSDDGGTTVGRAFQPPPADPSTEEVEEPVAPETTEPQPETSVPQEPSQQPETTQQPTQSPSEQPESSGQPQPTEEQPGTDPQQPTEQESTEQQAPGGESATQGIEQTPLGQ